MAFSTNPLSLSVPEQAFESWLRDSGYLEILDHRTSQLHTLNSTTTPTPPSTTTTSTSTTSTPTTRRTPTTTLTAISYGLIMSLFSSSTTLFSLLTINPFAKLTSSDFSHLKSSNWTTSSGFVGSFDSYSFPSSPIQAKLRVHENVKRFVTNYATLLILFFASSLYQMPLALVGLLSCLAIWEVFRFCDNKWSLNRFSTIREVLIRIAQCGVAVILLWSNVQMAVFSTLCVGYIVMMFHASFRKLTPAKQLSKGRGR